MTCWAVTIQGRSATQLPTCPALRFNPSASCDGGGARGCEHTTSGGSGVMRACGRDSIVEAWPRAHDGAVSAGVMSAWLRVPCSDRATRSYRRRAQLTSARVGTDLR